MHPIDELSRILKKLRLSGILQTLDLRTKQAVDESLAHSEFLYRLLNDEVERRDAKQLDTRLRRASFEHRKSIEDFDFSFNPKVPKAKLLELATCGFVDKRENLCIVGQSGVGKSHIAQAIGHRACMAGHTVLYTSANAMLKKLRASRALKRVPPEDVRPFVNAVPVYDLKIAAGRFSAPQAAQEVPQHAEVANPGAFKWVALEGATKPSPGLFVAQVSGESMNKKIPDGAWCLWRLNPAPKQGAIVLAVHNEIENTDLGSYTVKEFSSEKVAADGGGPAHTRVTLTPNSTDPTYQPQVIAGPEGEVRIIAELVRVLG